ncbi:MAG: hypothetical protein LVR00_03040 [Rhabdochlamydiaceae bacterium]|jgi:HEPN domain-containing protein
MKVGFFKNIYNFFYLKRHDSFINKHKIEEKARECIKEFTEMSEAMKAKVIRDVEVTLSKALKTEAHRVSAVFHAQVNAPKILEAAAQKVKGNLAIREMLESLSDRNMKALRPRAGKPCDYSIDKELLKFMDKYPGLRDLAEKFEKDVQKTHSLYEFAELLITYDEKILKILRAVEKDVGADEVTMANEVLMTLQTNTRLENAILETYQILDNFTKKKGSHGSIGKFIVMVCQYERAIRNLKN